MQRFATFPSMLALGAAAAFAADDAAAVGTNGLPSTNPGIAEFEFPYLEGKHEFDVATIPAEVRLDFLKGAVRAYIANRLHGVHTRHQKDEKAAAWVAYDEAVKADPLQSTVAKPEGERPPEPDYAEALKRAFDDLRAGNIRRVSGEPKARKTVDPLVKIVTEVVTREVFDSRRALDPKYTFVKAKGEVGGDGIAYLNKLIDAKVEAGQDRAALEKMRDEKYVNPAKAMLGLSANKKLNELPSIL